MNHILTNEEVYKLDEISLIINQPRFTNDRLERFVIEYETVKNREIKKTDKIRYFFSKRNVTFGELAALLEVNASSIGVGSSRTDSMIAYLMRAPVNEIYVQPSRKLSPSISERELKLKNAANKLRKLADELENNC